MSLYILSPRGGRDTVFYGHKQDTGVSSGHTQARVTVTFVTVAEGVPARPSPLVKTGSLGSGRRPGGPGGRAGAAPARRTVQGA